MKLIWEAGIEYYYQTRSYGTISYKLYLHHTIGLYDSVLTAEFAVNKYCENHFGSVPRLNSENTISRYYDLYLNDEGEVWKDAEIHDAPYQLIVFICAHVLNRVES